MSTAAAPPPRARGSSVRPGGAGGPGLAQLPRPGPSALARAHARALARTTRKRARSQTYQVGVQLIQVAGSPARVIGKKGRATLSSGVHVPGQTKPVFLGPVRVWPVELSTPEALKPVLREVGFLFKFVGKLWDLVNAPITMD